MTTSTLISNPADDAQLVERSLRGDTKAFGNIVERHQSLVCGLAYSACGSVHVSEDLAQETFIAAWQQLRTLREKSNLRGWLCGIARNVIHNFLRKQQRTPTAKAAELDEAVHPSSQEPTPDENVISEQESALLWRALQTLPTNYREPMVLYYRQQESVATVAESLDLSEDAVKQRLARGRAMLAEQMERMLGTTLRQTRPTAAFTLAVMASLPLATTSASAATAGAAVAKGSTGAKASALVVFNALLSPLLAVMAACIGYKVAMDSARSAEERAFIKRFYRFIAWFSAAFGGVLLALILGGKSLAATRPDLFAGLVMGMLALSLVVTGCAIRWAHRQNQKLPHLEAAVNPSAALPVGKWGVPFMEYRSKLTLLGLPLIQVRFGRKRGEPVRPVKAWFAVGDFAIGVIGAFGAFTIAPFSLGALALGGFSVGGFAAGIVCWGGIGIGIWSIGGLALGWIAYGGCTVGWQMAQGGLAVAHDYALAGAAVAAHANDAVAAAALRENTFIQIARSVVKYAALLNLLWFLPLVLLWRKGSQMRTK